MNEILPGAADAPSESERNVLLITYILYALFPFSLGLTSIIAVVINHLKVNETHSLFIRSHHRWLLRTFWYTLLWLVVCGVLMVTIILIPLCWLGFFVIGVWHLYRIVRGALNFIDRQPMPV